MSSPILEVKNLVTKFKTDRGLVAAVNDVSFNVFPGETLAIVGESGSGKSVTALSILGLIPNPPGYVEQGQIVFEGQDLLKLNEVDLRSIRGNQIAMIFQEPMSSMNPSLTVGLQVAEPIHQHQRTAWSKAVSMAGALLAKVQIPDAQNRLRSYPHQFSGGMRQRAMIAMALGCHPKLIIADEPTTALDVTVQAQVLDLLKELTEKSQTALIMITHDLGVVARYANRVAVMYAGRLVELASAADLYAYPRHPYTRGLMNSIPRIDGDTEIPLTPIEGQPPDLVNLEKGCAFKPRCPHAHNACSESVPILREVAINHYKAFVLND